MDRAVSRKDRLGRLAEATGRGLNRLAAAAATIPGLLGAGLVSYGAGQVYRPLLFIVPGVFLLLVDRRMPN